jgi:hypothetical protein
VKSQPSQLLLEAFMYDPPAYVWAMIIAGLTAIGATTCIVLYGGAVRAGLGPRRAALLAGAVLLGGWFTATGVIAGHGWYRTLLWFPVAEAGFVATPLALSRIPVVARTIAAPGMASRLMLPPGDRASPHGSPDSLNLHVTWELKRGRHGDL